MRQSGTIRGMNSEVRETVRQAMRERELTQMEFAQRLGMTQPALAKMLTGRTGQIPESWQKVLDELDLKLVAVPRGDNALDKLEVVGKLSESSVDIYDLMEFVEEIDRAIPFINRVRFLVNLNYIFVELKNNSPLTARRDVAEIWSRTLSKSNITLNVASKENRSSE